MKWIVRAALVWAALLSCGWAGAQLPSPDPRPVRPDWWASKVTGPVFVVQQYDTTTGRHIVELKNSAGTVVWTSDILGDVFATGFVEPGAFATGSLPSVTSSNAGALAFDTTANAPKFVNNAGTWTAFAGTGTVTGTGTNHSVAVWTGSSSIGTGLLTDDGAHQVQANATPTSSVASALFALGTEPAAGSSQGNYLSVNSGNAFAGDFADFEYSGVPKFVVDYTGAITSKALTPNSVVYTDANDKLGSVMLNSDFTLSGGGLGLSTEAGVTPGTYTNATITVDSKGRATGVSSGSVSGISGTGTVNTLPKFTASAQVGNSDITDDGTTITNGVATVLGGSLRYAETSPTTTYSVGNVTTILADATAGGFTVTLPAASANSGRIVQVIKIDSTGNTVTVAGAGADKINGSATASLSSQYGQEALVEGPDHSGTAAWWNYVASAPTLQSVMTAGSTSTVASVMTLSPTSGAPFQTTVADNHYAAELLSSAGGGTLHLSETVPGGGTPWGALIYGTTSGGNASQGAPLVKISDGSSSLNSTLLLDLLNANTDELTFTKGGDLTIASLANAGYLSTNGAGKLVVNASSPVTGGPYLPTGGGTMTGTITSQAIVPSPTATYTLGDGTHQWNQVYTTTAQSLAGSSLQLIGDGGITLQPKDVNGAADKIQVVNHGHIQGNTDLSGNVTLTAATSATVTFTRTYDAAPSCVVLTPQADPGAGVRWWVSGIGTTSFTVNTSSAVTMSFSYLVIE